MSFSRQNCKDSQFPYPGYHNQVDITRRDWRYFVCNEMAKILLISVLELKNKMFETSDHNDCLEKENVVVLYVLTVPPTLLYGSHCPPFLNVWLIFY